jgi:hypothetical protein
MVSVTVVALVFLEDLRVRALRLEFEPVVARRSRCRCGPGQAAVRRRYGICQRHDGVRYAMCSETAWSIRHPGRARGVTQAVGADRVPPEHALVGHASDARRASVLEKVPREHGPCLSTERQGHALAVFRVADQDHAGEVGDFYAIAAVGV